MKWIKASERLPELDSGEDYPQQYLIRVKGDDPRSGWIYTGYHTAESLAKDITGDYWEWLDESPQPVPPPKVGEEKVLRWVKAADRLPEIDGQICIRSHEVDYSAAWVRTRNDGERVICGMATQKSVWPGWKKNLEWLEEYIPTTPETVEDWVPVSEKLPDVPKIDFKDCMGHVMQGNYSRTSDTWYAYGIMEPIKYVTHWRPQTNPTPDREQPGEQDEKHIHISLGEGVTARVSPNASPELLVSLSKMVELAKQMPDVTPTAQSGESEAVKFTKDELKKEAIDFYDRVSKLTPVDKISVHGREGGFGPSDLTPEELYDNFKRWQKRQQNG